MESWSDILRLHPRAYARRLAWVALALLLLWLAAWLALYITRAQVHYSIARADCRVPAITARNQSEAIHSRACVLELSVTNLKAGRQYVNWNATGLITGSGTPFIHIHASGKHFCYVYLDTKQARALQPHETRILTLRCSTQQHPPENYDATSDQHPVSVTIDGYKGALLPVNPLR